MNGILIEVYLIINLYEPITLKRIPLQSPGPLVLAQTCD